MPRSLERHLSLTLAAVIVLAGVAAGGASFVFAYVQAQEFQDDTLRQIAALAGPQADRAYEGDAALDDPETRVLVLRLPGDRRPGWLPADLSAGFHTLAFADGKMRVFVREARRGGRIAVAQPTDVRDEIAIGSALRTLAPLVVLMPLLVWLAARVVRRELAPVRRLAHSVDAQPAARPEPLPLVDVPEEIAPFLRAINRLLERVGRLVGAQRRFVADAAHELRTPLTALSLQAQNLETAATLERMRERVTPLRAGIDRARRLTERLLSLARSQAGGGPARPVEVSIIARELIADHLPLAETRGIDLGLEEATADLVLAADPDSLRSVLKNALDNALRCTPAKGEVTLRLAAEGEDALIEVIDTGPGIPAAERERVFQPFYRLENAVGEGSGLGLAIARDAAERLGGSVSLDERAGGGLVFRYRQKRWIT